MLRFFGVGFIFSLKSVVEILQFGRFFSGNYYLAWFAKEGGNCVLTFC